MSSHPHLTIVICLDHAYVTGGQARVAFDSARGLKAAGHRPIVFAAAGPVARELDEAGIEVVCLGQSDLLGNPSRLAAAIQGIWNKAAVERLASLLATLDPTRTIVHVHGWAKALSPSIAAPIAASGLPAVYTIHEYFLFCPNGGFYNYQEQHVCGLTPLSAACWATHCDSRTYVRKLWRTARLSLATTLAKFPDVFSDYVTISGTQAAIVTPYLPAEAILHHVSNPIDAVDLGPKPAPAAGDILFLGRLSPEKGPFVFAEAARLAGLTPVFAGDGPLAGEIAARYPEARLLGWQDAAGVQAALRGARALVFPSLWFEGQPLTVLEAKALGTPVIVSDVCAGREEVEDGVTGLWFRSGDAADLARALRDITDDRQVEAMSAAAYAAYWAAPPTLDRHVAQVSAIYRAMLARAGHLPAAASTSSPVAA